MLHELHGRRDGYLPSPKRRISSIGEQRPNDKENKATDISKLASSIGNVSEKITERNAIVYQYESSGFTPQNQIVRKAQDLTPAVDVKFIKNNGCV